VVLGVPLGEDVADAALPFSPFDHVLQVYLPPSITGRSATGDPEVLEFHKQLNALNRKLADKEIDIPPEGERSPSPPPLYDSMGIRLNTREVRWAS
jgi:Splicing factor 1 helix-hairpin domain